MREHHAERRFYYGLAVVGFFIMLFFGCYCCQLHPQPVSIEVASQNWVDHGETLAEVMNGIRSEDYEISAAFTAEGEKLFEYTNYNETSVIISEHELQLLSAESGAIILHNHPVWDQASFSLDDLQFLACHKASVGIVVSKKYTYVVVARHGWPDSEQLSEFMQRSSSLMSEIWFDDTEGQAYRSTVTTNALMRAVATEFNLDYYEWNNSKVPATDIADAILTK